MRRSSLARVIGLTGLLLVLGAPRAEAQTFNITSITTGGGGTAAGTSNGISWSCSPTFVSVLSHAGGAATVYSNPSFHNPPLATSDILHVGNQSFTLTFGQSIGTMLLYVAENGTPDCEFNFGQVPTVVSGSFSVTGTKFKPTAMSGGLIRFDNINSTTLTHTATGVIGGAHLAFVVTPQQSTPLVPEPGSLTLMLPATGLAGILLTRRRFPR